MQKSLVKLLMSFLSVNLVLQSANIVINAQASSAEDLYATEESEMVEDPTTSEEPSVTEEPDPDPDPEYTETTEEPWAPPTEPYTTTTYYEIPEPAPEERQEITTIEQVTYEETTVEEGYGSLNEANLNGLLSDSLNSQEFVLAWEDYQLITNNFRLHDLINPEEVGSTLEEIQNFFTGHGQFELGRNNFGQPVLVAEYNQELVQAVQAETEQVEVIGEDNNEADSELVSEPARIVLTFNEDEYLIGTGLYQSPDDIVDLEGIHPALVASLVDSPVEVLHEERMGVIGFYQSMADGSIFTGVLSPTLEGEDQEELIIVNSYNVLSHESIQVAEAEEKDYQRLTQNKLLVFLSSQYEGIELPQVEEETSEGTVQEIAEESLEESSQASTEESLESSESTAEESLESSESTDEESSESSEVGDETSSEVTRNKESKEFIDQFGPQVEIAEEDLVDFDYISRGYSTLKSRIINGQLNQSKEDVIRAIAPPTIEESNEIGQVIKYYSISDNRIGYLMVQFDEAQEQVLSLRYEVRTPQLNEDFPITLDELIELGGQNMNVDSLSSAIGNPVIIEHSFAGEELVRYLWTSFTDPEMRNIELLRNTKDNTYELFYFDQDSAESSEEAAE